MPDTMVYVVDDDSDVRDSLKFLLESAGFGVRTFAAPKVFLESFAPHARCCLLTDIRMPEMDGMELLAAMLERKCGVPVILMTGHGDVPLAVRAMRAGAVDFIEKPFDDERLIASINAALSLSLKTQNEVARANGAAANLAELTDRERDVLALLVAGHANKVVAHMLNISPRTVEVHRGRLMEKMQAKNLADLVRMALAANLPEVSGK